MITTIRGQTRDGDSDSRNPSIRICHIRSDDIEVDLILVRRRCLGPDISVAIGTVLDSLKSIEHGFVLLGVVCGAAFSSVSSGRQSGDSDEEEK